jgi:L-2-hydroxyglutarate oxidase
VWPDARLLDDFQFVKGERILHVVNSASAAATASLAIGERIVAEIESVTSRQRLASEV